MNQFNLDLSLRAVTQEDESLVLAWANDPEVRRWSWKNTLEIQTSEHRQWFKEKLANENTGIWIMQRQGVSCGLIRIEVEGHIAILNYSIAAEHRGKNLGTRMLCLAVEKVLSEYGPLKIIAHTIPKNAVSHKTLEKAGFTKDTSISTARCVSYVFIGDGKES